MPLKNPWGWPGTMCACTAGGVSHSATSNASAMRPKETAQGFVLMEHTDTAARRENAIVFRAACRLRVGRGCTSIPPHRCGQAEDDIMELTTGASRPRNVDWKRAAALLYGDWGTSKAYVTGIAFVAAGYSSLPIVLAVCALTGIVGINYVIICKHFPDGGGVYSAARDQSRLLAVIGALLLVADLTVTAALSGWSAMTYFKVPKDWIWAATL